MNDEDPELRAGMRVALVLGGLALAALFGGFGAAILWAPIHDPSMPPWSGFAVCAFVFFIFGAFAALGVYCVYAGLRGTGAPRGIPARITARCPACGELRPEPPPGQTPVGIAASDPCPSCGRAAGVLARAWTETPRETLGGPFFLGMLGCGITSMGVLCAAGVLSKDESAIVRAGYAALALLLLLVGAAMVWGGALTVRETWANRRRRVFTLDVEEELEHVVATATLEAGTLKLDGYALRYRPFEDVPEEPAPEGALRGPAADLARVLAVLHARGAVTFVHCERLEWQLAEDGAPVRSRGIALYVRAPSPPADAEPGTPVDLRDRVLAALVEHGTAGALLAALEEDGALRNAFEVYASELPAGEADPATLRRLTAHLRDGAAPAPYRHPG